MGAHSRDERLLMCFFQESLAGVAVTWYTHLEPSQIHSWKDLMVAFIKQYRYNLGAAPDRTQLRDMCKKEHKSFKGYAQRWKDMAAHVAPLIMEKELIAMIINTLPMSYHAEMASYMPSSFTDLVFAGERIEVALGIGKFDHLALTRRRGRNPCSNRFLHGQISHLLNHAITQPISALLITHLPISHKVCLLHNQCRTPPLAQTKTPIEEGILQKRNL